MRKECDLIIIGAGPAGMTAAIYASRAGLKTVMLEEGAPGGKLTKTFEIDNYPGAAKANGFELANLMFQQSTSFGAVYEYGSVVSINSGDLKIVTCEDGSEYAAKAVIVASGTKERLLNIPGEEDNIGRGVSYCAVCDGAFFRDKTVAVIGGGNSALEEALYLTQFAAKVYVIIRRDVFRADQLVVDEINANPKIEVITKHIPIAIIDDGSKVKSLQLRNVSDESEQELAVDGIFPYIGADPITGFLKDLDVCDEHGYMMVDANQETSVKGIYGAGDVCAKGLRQVVTATSDGAVAAQAVVKAIK